MLYMIPGCENKIKLKLFKAPCAHNPTQPNLTLIPIDYPLNHHITLGTLSSWHYIAKALHHLVPWHLITQPLKTAKK